MFTFQEEMRQNFRTWNDVIIHEVDEKCSSEKSSKFEQEVEPAAVDLTVVGHRFDAAACFCVKSPKRRIPKSSSTPALGQMSTKHLLSDQSTSTSDLPRNLPLPEEVIDAGDDDDEDDDDDGADTYSCSSVSSRSSRDPRCPRCFIIANTDCSNAVYV